MKIVFISNFYNHHQSSLSENLYKLTNGSYCFIATKPMPLERKKLGYPEVFPSFVRLFYKDENSRKECQNIIDNADIVISGASPYRLVSRRVSQNKLTFFYNERRFKVDVSWYKKLKTSVRLWLDWGRYKNNYMLCASAYAASDEKSVFSFVNRCFRWGYFPVVKNYENVERIIDKKKEASLLWVARFIDWKHPECAVEAVKKLKNDGYNVNLSMIGIGPETDNIKSLISKYNLQNEIKVLGSMSPSEVRNYMEESEIFLFTSDKNEGWGAVLNESMNSACAVVASHAIGAVPFLVEDGKNGLIYKDGDVDDICRKVEWLLDNKQNRKEISRKAYETMINTWNAENAASAFIKLAECLNKSNDTPFKTGPCSRAEILYDDWR